MTMRQMPLNPYKYDRATLEKARVLLRAAPKKVVLERGVVAEVSRQTGLPKRIVALVREIDLAEQENA
jgi:hypothetical protein